MPPETAAQSGRDTECARCDITPVRNGSLGGASIAEANFRVRRDPGLNANGQHCGSLVRLSVRTIVRLFPTDLKAHCRKIRAGRSRLRTVSTVLVLKTKV